MRKPLRTVSFLPAIFFPLGAMFIGLRNRPIFNVSVVSNALPLFIVFLFMLGIFLALRFLGKSSWMANSLPGLFLWLLFGVGYFLLASILNRADLNTNNLYFAADSWSWYQRMGSPEGLETGIRAVHPLASIIFRPIVAVLSVLTHGDRFSANLALLGFAGGGCVFLMWNIVKDISDSDIYAVLFASLLGVSASHLIFASVIETYIFSGFFLLLFIWFLLRNRPAYLLAIASILTLGITVTNIVQQGLTSLFVRRNLRQLVFFFSIVVLGAAGLNILARLIYPSTEYFFLPQNLTGEQRFAQEINFKRAGLMIENLLVYNVVAPQPYSTTRNAMPRFNFLNGTIRDYAWFGWPGFVLWIASLCLAIFQFVKNFQAKPVERYLSIALLTCLAFNFLLHLGYGSEPFLYSADWTYALVLFVAVSLAGLADQVWFNLTLIPLVGLVLLNNLWLLYLIARNVSPFLG